MVISAVQGIQQVWERSPAHRLGHQQKVRSLPGTQPLQLALVGGVLSQLVIAQVWASLLDIRSHSGGPTLGSVSSSLPLAMPSLHRGPPSGKEFFSRPKEQWANCVNIYMEEAVSFTQPYPERLHSMMCL